VKIKIFVAHHEVTLLLLYPLMVRAFDPSVDEQSLIFQYNFANNTFTDKQTGSKWDFEGKSIEGQLKGKQLLRLPFDEGYWFKWTALHPNTKIYS
jgi:hypothetical protein